MSAPLVFDRGLVRRRLQRALQGGYADFLLRRAVDDFDERLATVVRRFPLAADIGTPTSLLAERLGASERVDAVVRLAPIVEPRSSGLTVAGDAEALPFAPERFDLAASLL